MVESKSAEERAVLESVHKDWGGGHGREISAVHQLGIAAVLGVIDEEMLHVSESA